MSGNSVKHTYSLRDNWFGKPQGYIRITRKFRQKLREITFEDVKKEGYNSLEEFRRAWEEIHGPGSWNPNETVIVYEFRAVKKTEE